MHHLVSSYIVFLDVIFIRVEAGVIPSTENVGLEHFFKCKPHL